MMTSTQANVTTERLALQCHRLAAILLDAELISTDDPETGAAVDTFTWAWSATLLALERGDREAVEREFWRAVAASQKLARAEARETGANILELQTKKKTAPPLRAKPSV